MSEKFILHDLGGGKFRPDFPLVFDNTMRSAFVECPRKFELEFIQHWKPQGQRVDLHAGGAWAHGLERTRKGFYCDGEPSDVAIAAGIAALLEFYGDFICPENNPKTAARLAEAFVFYFERYPLATDPAQPYVGPNGPMIEFSFVHPLDDSLVHPITGDPILYSGRADMVANYLGACTIFDDKTTKSLGATWTNQWDLRSQFTGYCLPGDTEFLSQTGWKRIDAYAPGDTVAQWGEGQITFVKPTAYHTPHFAGDLIGFEGKVSILGTPDHRQPVYNKWTGKWETYPLIKLPYTNASHRFCSAGVKADGDALPPALTRLLVATQADGSYSDKTIRFHFKKERKIERLLHILDEVGIDKTVSKHSDGTTLIRLASCQEVELLRAVLGPEKSFGSWLLDFDGETLKTFIEELKYWDGSERPGRGDLYFSTDANAVEWVRTAACLAGYHTSIHSQTPGNYRVVLNETHLHSTHLHTPISVPHNGPVYCFTVPSSYFLIRRNGKIAVTGNCWAAQQYGIPAQQVLARGIGILKTKFDTANAIVHREEWRVERWKAQVLRDIRRAMQLWEEGFFDMVEADACNSYGGCMFKQPCLSRDPEPWLEIAFTRKRWDPVTRSEIEVVK